MSTPVEPGDVDPTIDEPDPADAPEPGSVAAEPHDDTGLDLAAMIAHAARGNAPGRRPKARRRRPDNPQFSGSRDDGRDPQPLSRAVGRLADERGWTTTVSVHVLLARWPAVVGPVVAQHSTPESYADGTLTVRADSTAWASQLRLMAPQILAAVNEAVGQGSIELVRILGPDAPSWKHGSRSVSDARGPRDTYG